jgi:hypothetical protein
MLTFRASYGNTSHVIKYVTKEIGAAGASEVFHVSTKLDTVTLFYNE